MITGLLIGGAVAIVAGVVGHFEGYLMGVKVRNVSALYAVSDSSQDTTACLCGHTVNNHRSRGAGNCTALIGEAGIAGSTCTCRYFVASPPQITGGQLAL